mmetsp:Transcript_12568/g.18478  ORF Transcript_12568/g.18478 Transcript_12568/m.18478 type:complete len:208 (-) Transcript_12568:606-1229(-)
MFQSIFGQIGVVRRKENRLIVVDQQLNGAFNRIFQNLEQVIFQLPVERKSVGALIVIFGFRFPNNILHSSGRISSPHMNGSILRLNKPMVFHDGFHAAKNRWYGFKQYSKNMLGQIDIIPLIGDRIAFLIRIGLKYVVQTIDFFKIPILSSNTNEAIVILLQVDNHGLYHLFRINFFSTSKKRIVTHILSLWHICWTAPVHTTFWGL